MEKFMTLELYIQSIVQFIEQQDSEFAWLGFGLASAQYPPLSTISSLLEWYCLFCDTVCWRHIIWLLILQGDYNKQIALSLEKVGSI